MDCDKALEMMSLYIDGELNKEEQEKLFKHIDYCEKCRQEFEILKEMVDLLKQEEFLPLPLGYHEELMDKVNNTKIETVDFAKAVKKNKNKWKKYGSIAAAGLLFVLVGAAASSLDFNGYNKNDTAVAPQASTEFYSGMAKTAMEAPQEAYVEERGYSVGAEESVQGDMAVNDGGAVNQDVGGTQTNINISDRKKIKTAYITLTVGNFEQAVENIRQEVEGENGYVENFNSYVYKQDNDKALKAGSITLRMDKDNYEQIKGYVKSIGEVTYEDENVNDITSQYIDTQGRLKAKRVEEERLLEILTSAETIQDIIAIEERISNIRGEIESYQSTIDNWDKMVELSTISVELREEEPVAVGTISSDFVTKVKENFIGSVNMVVNGFQKIVLGVVAISLPLLAIASVAAVVSIIIIKIRKKRRS